MVAKICEIRKIVEFWIIITFFVNDIIILCRPWKNMLSMKLSDNNIDTSKKFNIKNLEYFSVSFIIYPNIIRWFQ